MSTDVTLARKVVNGEPCSDSSYPFVSIIVPEYNDAAGVQRCLDALMSQIYPSNYFEVVIIDNGSSNPPVIKNGDYPFECRVLQCFTPGAYAARNYGVRAVDGDILVFTDADCIPAEQWLYAGVKELLKHADKAVIIGGEVLLLEPEDKTGTALYQFVTGFQQEENIKERGFSATANIFCWTKSFQDIGFFDERLLSGGDREWCWRAARVGLAITYCPSAVVYTYPRSSLKSAIRQARRVAAGRKALRELGMAHLGVDKLEPHRGTFASIAWILWNPRLQLLERLRVLGVAIVIKGAILFERLRLFLGFPPERR